MQTQIEELELENQKYKDQLKSLHEVTQQMDNTVDVIEKFLVEGEDELPKLKQILSQTHFDKIKGFLSGLNKLEENIDQEIGH